MMRFGPTIFCHPVLLAHACCFFECRRTMRTGTRSESCPAAIASTWAAWTSGWAAGGPARCASTTQGGAWESLRRMEGKTQPEPG